MKHLLVVFVILSILSFNLYFADVIVVAVSYGCSSS